MIRYEMFNTTNGERVWYTPLEPGVYQIYVLFGGLNVPGDLILINVANVNVALLQTFQIRVSSLFLIVHSTKIMTNCLIL